jgi:hypothetical protein
MKVLSGYSEDIICEHLCAYVRLKYPGVLFVHIANERRCHAGRGLKLKLRNVTAGYPDYVMHCCNFDGSKSLLALEIKREKGVLSKRQKEVLAQLAEQDAYSVYVAYGYDAAIDVIEGYVNGRKFQSKQRKQEF